MIEMSEEEYEQEYDSGDGLFAVGQAVREVAHLLANPTRDKIPYGVLHINPNAAVALNILYTFSEATENNFLKRTIERIFASSRSKRVKELLSLLRGGEAVKPIINLQRFKRIWTGGEDYE